MKRTWRVASLLLPLLWSACGADDPTSTQTASAGLSTVSVKVDRPSYAPGQTITVTYSGLPGNAYDWIALAPAGTQNTSYVAYVFTNGQTSGSATFTAPSAATYIARAFPNNTFALLGESTSFLVAVPGVSTDRSIYGVGATIAVSYTGMPGNTDDWIAIAPAGAAATTYLAYVFTGGAVAGTAIFTAPTDGSYVARAFPHNTYDLLAQSPTFTISSAPAVRTDQSSYATGSTLTVTYAGLPGNLDDWIALAPAGAPDTTYLSYVFTSGQTSGTATFTTPGAGTYVARAFPHNTFSKLAESASFTVVAPAVATNGSLYLVGQTIAVTYAGLPGNGDDWIALAPAGAPNTTYLAYVFTGGQTSGTATFTAPAAGTYVARAFPHNTYQLLAESPSVTTTATPSVATSRSSYLPGGTVTVAYAGLPGNSDDWIALAPASAPNTTYLARVFTGGQTSGTATFTAPAAGTYVARAFPHNTYQLLAESPAFTTGLPSVATDRSSYGSGGGVITVSYANLPGNADDWIALAPADSNNTAYVGYVVTNGQVNGTATFVVPANGTYVARAFPHNTFALLAQSANFTVSTGTPISTDQPTYAVGSTITISYAGLPGNADDWVTIAPAGSANTNYFAFVVTGGKTSGTATFAAPAAGTYVARAFAHNTFNLVAQSASFTTSGNTLAPCAAYGITITTDKTAYADTAARIAVTFSGMRDRADGLLLLGQPWPASLMQQWFGPGNPNTETYLTSGTHTFSAAPFAGTYDIGYQSTSAGIPYCLGATISIYTPTATTLTTDKLTYWTGNGSYSQGLRSYIDVTYKNLPNVGVNTIYLSVAGSPLGQFLPGAFDSTNAANGTDLFINAPQNPGQYVLRVFQGTALLAESAFITVIPVPTTPPTISTDKSSYKLSEPIIVTYAGLPGNKYDKISIARTIDDDSSEYAAVLTNQQNSGTATFKVSVAGTYEARAVLSEIVARSAPFTVK